MADYSEEYIDNVFYKWHGADRVISQAFITQLEPDLNGRTPTRESVIKWKDSRGWVERADALDAEISVRKDQEIIDLRMEMFKKHAEIGGQLVEKGLSYLQEHGVENSASAIRAIDLGLTTERISTGLAEVYVKISKMSDEALTKELQKLIGGGTKDEDTIDAEITDET